MATQNIFGRPSGSSTPPNEKLVDLSLHESNNSRHSEFRSDKSSVVAFERASEVESARHSLYPVTSYAGQIGGEDSGLPDKLPDSGEKDPNLVEWEGLDDPENPYNWYSVVFRL